jgi:hypothetical protein
MGGRGHAGDDADGGKGRLNFLYLPLTFTNSLRQLILKGASMDKSTQDKRLNNDHIVTARSSRRRLFLKLLGGGVLGAMVVAASIGGIERAEANDFEPLWNSALVLIGNSPGNQNPSSFIQCPLFFDNGQFADAFHTLDLSHLQTTRAVGRSSTLTTLLYLTFRIRSGTREAGPDASGHGPRPRGLSSPRG